jgi:predicted ATPase
VEEGLAALAEALDIVEATGERKDASTLYRLQGELRGQAGHRSEEMAACFHHALTMAHQQQAKSLELRAALSLSRLWLQQGKRTAAYDLLAPIYGWFSEGFETADLQEAKAVLAECA